MYEQYVGVESGVIVPRVPRVVGAGPVGETHPEVELTLGPPQHVHLLL